MAGDVLESHISGLAILIPSDISMQDLGLGCAPSGSVVAWQRGGVAACLSVETCCLGAWAISAL